MTIENDPADPAEALRSSSKRTEKKTTEAIGADDPFSVLSARLVEKGYTPHTKPVPLSSGIEFWWDKESGVFEWPHAVTLIALMIFILLLVQGVPWQ